ncbi:MAG: PEP-CTERM system histidine kinase PrsK [Gammaproteobacteria bacterium]|nr:PEP-CTERM system histidine kinase PrsK [Gammaproteobacteria bacterium]MCP5195732.1 PEP-CTERM system histidine kinase PrsK [Gammaproteobacteria bacterium]
MTQLGMIGYGASAIGWLILFLLLLTSWRGRLQGGLLVVAVLATLLWALRASFYAGAGVAKIDWLYQVLEVAHNAAWLIFLAALLEPLVCEIWTRRWMQWFWVVLTGYAAVLLAADLQSLLDFGFDLPVDAAILGHIGLAIAGMALIEQLFRNTHPQRRWATKFLYLGLGLLFAYDFFLYADALLFKRLDPVIWEARGLVGSLAAPLIAIAAARNPEWSMEVFVSRRVVLHSATIFGAGIYLLTMAGAGYYVRIYGGAWGTTLQFAFLVGAGVLLAALLFSGQLRARALVLMNKHFFDYKYDYREEWLKFIGTLSSGDPNEPPRERVIRAVAEIVHSTGGSLWVRREPGGFAWVASHNRRDQGELAIRIEPSDSSLMRFLEKRQWVIELDEYWREPELYGDLALPSWLREARRVWLIVPLLLGEHLQGFLVLAESRAPQRINWEDRDLLKTAGRQAASYVALLEASEALSEARQFEAFHRLSAYVVHDLKNIAAQLALVVANAARHGQNPAFVEDAFRTVTNATERMNRLLAQLRKEPPASAARALALKTAVHRAVEARAVQRPAPVARVVTDDEPWVQVDPERLVAVLEHLIQNAQDATKAEGQVEVVVYSEKQMAVVAVRDNGCGMDERFVREQLFRPFTTTKGNAGMGIGVYESREFAHAAGGELAVESQIDQGTTFFLRLPLVENPTVANIESENREWKNPTESC